MKRIVASVGLVALGASCIQSASAQGFLKGPDGSKPWSVSATLRGFYDDNVSSIPDDYPLAPGEEEDSFGFEISPAARFVWDRQQTMISLDYKYSYKYFDNRPVYNNDHDDQSHTFNAILNHAFNERYAIRASDSFVLGQEPDLLRAGDTFATFQRVSGDNIRNYGQIAFDADLTRLFAAEVGYANVYYNYDDDGPGSRSAYLDRLEHSVRLDGKWKVSPTTTGILGYTYNQVDYTADELVGYGLGGVDVTPYYSDVRNSRSHYFYAGVDHAFTPDLSGSLRAGGRYIDFYNDPSGESTVSPYVRGSLRYFYAPESFVEGGFGYDRTPTDVAFNPTAADLTLDADTFTIFGTVSHKIASKLYGSLTAQFQNTAFNGGYADGETEQIYLAGVQLEYRINQYLSSHVGYNFDKLESDLGRSFDRNRVYVGVTASY